MAQFAILNSSWWKTGETPFSKEGMPVAGGSIRKLMSRWSCCALCAAISVPTLSAEEADADRTPIEQQESLQSESQQPKTQQPKFQQPGTGIQGSSSKELRQQAIANLPLERLTRKAQERILAIANSPTIYRRLPAQAIDCDREMFLFLSRNPEVMVGMWELMGITKVKTRRTGLYQLEADDGSGTKCNIDLVYGDPNVHVFVTEGSYEGLLTARPMRGKGVVILRSTYAEGIDGRTTVNGTIDLFMQVENFGVELIARTLSFMIGRSADYNFIETARFVSQISQASERNPPAMIDVANRMPQVSDQTRQQFIEIITDLGERKTAEGRIAEGPVILRR